MQRPNLLLITSDQQHWFTLGVQNPKIKTPNLDRLAKLGLRCDRAYCPNPTCTPTRASILTGQYPSTHGAYTLGTKLPDDAPTFPGVLREAGYHTSLIGKAHFQPLTSNEKCESVESYPLLRDLDFWRTFNDTHTPWYGFDHVELARNHADEGHVGQHYALWMEQHGLDNWRDYFFPRQDGVKDTPTDGSQAPPERPGPGYGWRSDMTWKLPEEFHYTAWTGQRTIAMIEQAHAAGQPFFCWASYHDPHPPYCVPEPWASMYDPQDMEPGRFVDGEFDDMPPIYAMTRDPDASFAEFQTGGAAHGCHPHTGIDEQHLKEAMAIYYGMISFMDHWIGQTLDTLERLGLLDDTLVVFSTDHGHFLNQHGLLAKGPFPYEDVVRVPFLASWPKHIPADQVTDALQSLVDLAPTFLQAAGLEQPLWVQGVNQLPVWTGQQDSARDHVFVENHHSYNEAVHQRTLITGRYKLTLWRGRGWGELFDLQDDPSELKNLYNDPAHAELKAQMLEQFVLSDLEREPAPMPRVAGA